MKPRLFVLLLLVSMMLLVGLAPAAAQTTPQPPAPPAVPTRPREIPEYRPPAHTPERNRGPQDGALLPAQEEAVDPRRAERAERRAAPTAGPAAPLSYSAGPQLPITSGPWRIPFDVLEDSPEDAYAPSVSADGRYTVYFSWARNLAPGDMDTQPDVIIYDRDTGQEALVSVPADGGQIYGYFYEPSVSDDGRYVAFYGWTNDLVPPEEAWSSDIYVVDRNDGSVSRISDAYDGGEANGSSYSPVISPDGGYVAFRSYASNLVEGDSNGLDDIFLHDIAAGTTVRVSVSDSEAEADDSSYLGGVSEDGQVVSFYSYATNLVANDTNDWADVFVRDVAGGTTARVSVGSGAPGTQANGDSYESDISADGRYVAFASYADNLIAGDTNGTGDIFVRDLVTNTTFRVSHDENGAEADNDSFRPSLSADGRTVAFASYAALVAGDTNGESDVYTRNWDTGSVARVSIADGGGDADNYAGESALSADGSAVAFVSYATNLVAGDGNGAADIFLRDLPGGPTTLVSHDIFTLEEPNYNSGEPVVSNDGRYFAFSSEANNLVPGDSAGDMDVFVYDGQLHETTLITLRYWGGQSYNSSYSPAISDDGNRVVFVSWDDYLVEYDDNGQSDIFVYDRVADTMARVSVDSAGNGSDGNSFDPAISGDGNVIAFESYAANLVPGDTNDAQDIFVHDLLTGQTTRVSVSSAGDQGFGDSYSPSLSTNGRYVAFESDSDTLVGDDYNGTTDVFVHDRVTGETTLVSRNVWGYAADYDSWGASISPEGRYVAFTSYSYDLVTDDENWAYDIFVRDLWLERTAKISHAPGGDPTDYNSYLPDVTSDGRYIVFESMASNLVPDDTNQTGDVFLYDRLSGETARLSESASGEEGNSYSDQVTLSTYGTMAVFSSSASNLVPDDTYGLIDVFWVEQDVNDPLYSVSGTVLNGGGFPIEGAVVTAVGAPANFALTDENGEYSLTFPAGTYDLTAGLENYWFRPETRTVTVGPNRTGIDFEGTDLGSYSAWFIPTDDAYVDQAKRTTNFGSAAILRVKNAAADANAYLKFEVDGFEDGPDWCKSISYAALVNHVKEPSNDGGAVYSVGNNWTEGAINWNNAPPIAGAPLGSFGAVADETSAWAGLGRAVAGNGVYSFAIRNASTNSVDYSSKEGQYHPWLYVQYNNDFDARLTAEIGWSHSSGLAPLTVQFNDYSYGCPTSWLWDFGDGTTSTEREPSHTYTEVGSYDLSLTVTNDQGSDQVAYSEVVHVVAPPSLVYISPATIANIGGIPAQPADILLYDKAANDWTMVFDGSDHALTKNIGSFSFANNGDLLLVYSVNQTIPGLGVATPRDIVRFTPDTPWDFPLTTGVYSWEMRGNWPGVGLTTTKESIDALDESWGDYFVSTVSAASVLSNPPLKAADEDVIFWSSWEPAWRRWVPIDGSVIPGLAAEDIIAVWQDSDTYNDYYVAILGPYNLGGVSGNGKNIVRLNETDSGWTATNFAWLAPGMVFPSTIDAIELAR